MIEHQLWAGLRLDQESFNSFGAVEEIAAGQLGEFGGKRTWSCVTEHQKGTQ